MKRIKIILSVSVLLVALSGCGNQKPQNNDNQTNNDTTTEATTDNSDTNNNSNSKNVDNNTNKSEDKNNTETNHTSSSSTASKNTNIAVQKDSNNTKATNNNTISQNNAKETSNDEKSFYGNWQITRVVRHSKIVALPDESKFIGQIMNFSNNESNFVDIDINLDNNETKIVPQYFPNPKYTITNMNKKDFILYFNCYPSDLGIDSDTATLFTADTTSKTSHLIIVKDNDTLIYPNQGVYFELKRVV